jgi:hypothetical protein
MFYGYWSDKTVNPMIADEAECFRRILLGGPWKWTEHYMNGVKGVLAFRGELESLDAKDFRPCSDGLLFFCKSLPDQPALAKEVNSPRFPVTLKSGRVIDIPLAVYAPRVLAFDSMEEGEHATEFGREAFRIWQRIDEKNWPSNTEVKRLIFLAVQQCYAVTEELLSKIAWITDADIVPIVLAISGRNPKSVAAASDISHSHAAAS